MTAPTKHDWRLILLVVGGGAGAVLCAGIAAAVAGYSLMERWLRPIAFSQLGTDDLNAVSTLFAGMLLIAALLLATMLAALRVIRGQAEPPFTVRPMHWYVVLAWVAVWLGASVLVQVLHERAAAAWASPLLQLAAIVTPIYVFVRLGLAGVDGGSKLRLLGSMSAGMLLGTGAAAAAEILLLIAAVAAGAVYLIANPQLILALQQLAIQVAHAARPEESLALIGPILTRPAALLLALAAIARATPFVEEIAKSLPVWAIFDRVSTGAQGFWAGALSGAGFALLEGLMVSSGSGDGLAVVLLFRAGSSLMHILASGLTGWGIGAFRNSGSVTRIVAGYLAAMGIHAFWNAVIVAVGYGGLRATYAVTQPDPFGLMLSMFGMMMLAALIVVMPLALAGLNHRFRNREMAALRSVHAKTPPPRASDGQKNGEAP